MAKYEIGFKKGKTESEYYWRFWLWTKDSENNIFGIIGKLIRELLFKDKT